MQMQRLASSAWTGARIENGKPSGETIDTTAVGWRAPSSSIRGCQALPPPSGPAWNRSGSSEWPERTSSMWASYSSGSAPGAPGGHTYTRSGRTWT